MPVERGDAAPPTDTELWARGDEAAFTELFERHAEAVWNHCYRLTGSWSMADDLTSATFLTAWRKRAELTLVRESALPWLYTVAGNRARSEYRGDVRRLRLLHRIPDPPFVPDHSESVADKLDGERRLRTVVDAVAKLPAAQRQAVELCLLGEVPVADAAAILGISEVTVRANLSRARARLRTVFEERP